MKQIAEIIEQLYERCETKFPLNNSSIPLLILAKTIRHESNGTELPLKVLCAELKSSDLCTRTHVKKLEQRNWVKINKSKTDGRMKIVKSTPKLINAFQGLSDEFKSR
ncbi:MAG: hypothetical protein EBV25_01240 [Methylophilaceae bacterium]|nr:hypothetical protein [Methylophilaceae bacterium]NCA27011.1 hypothetical protein [Methylophilaceae bacterium]